MKPFCRKCKKDIDNIGGYLQRVNAKGEAAIWECRPSCDAQQTQKQNLLDAIQSDEIPKDV